MKENIRILIGYIILISAITIICVTAILAVAWIFTPTDFSISFHMDNNTLEAVKSINWSALPR